MLLLSNELKFFSFSFLDEEGSWQNVWDSSQLVQADQLPIAVKIELALADSLGFPDGQDDELSDGFDEDRAAPYSRTVVLPLRPLDLAALTDPKGPYAFGGGPADEQSEEDETEGEDADADTASDEDPCPSRRTVRDCFNIEAAQRDVDEGGSAGPSSIATFWNNPAVAGSCFDDHRRTISTIFIRPECL